jgi:hypothetical protein
MMFRGANTRFIIMGPGNEIIDLSIDSQSLAGRVLQLVFRCKVIAACSTRKDDFSNFFLTAQKVVVVGRELSASVAALD